MPFNLQQFRQKHDIPETITDYQIAMAFMKCIKVDDVKKSQWQDELFKGHLQTEFDYENFIHSKLDELYPETQRGTLEKGLLDFLSGDVVKRLAYQASAHVYGQAAVAVAKQHGKKLDPAKLYEIIVADQDSLSGEKGFIHVNLKHALQQQGLELGHVKSKLDYSAIALAYIATTERLSGKEVAVTSTIYPDAAAVATLMRDVLEPHLVTHPNRLTITDTKSARSQLRIALGQQFLGLDNQDTMVLESYASQSIMQQLQANLSSRYPQLVQDLSEMLAAASTLPSTVIEEQIGDVARITQPSPVTAEQQPAIVADVAPKSIVTSNPTPVKTIVATNSTSASGLNVSGFALASSGTLSAIGATGLILFGLSNPIGWGILGIGAVVGATTLAFKAADYLGNKRQHKAVQSSLPAQNTTEVVASPVAGQNYAAPRCDATSAHFAANGLANQSPSASEQVKPVPSIVI